MNINECVYFMIVDSVTDDVWISDHGFNDNGIYLSEEGCKSSFLFNNKKGNKYQKPDGLRFDDQTKYKIVKVKVCQIIGK